MTTVRVVHLHQQEHRATSRGSREQQAEEDRVVRRRKQSWVPHNSLSFGKVGTQILSTIHQPLHAGGRPSFGRVGLLISQNEGCPLTPENVPPTLYPANNPAEPAI